jgi:tryptophan 7-halogenase
MSSTPEEIPHTLTADELTNVIGFDRELETHRRRLREPRDAPPDPDGYRTVGIVGGGTAGYLTALAFRARHPHMEVTLIESKQVPIIGVGEATVPGILTFLHKRLKVDIHDFWAKVKPTWKEGIQFFWGLPGDYVFQAPFDWGSNQIGLLGSLAYQGDVNAMSVEALMMERQLTPVLGSSDDDVVSLLPRFPFAYHLDNVRFVRYLTDLAADRGVRHLDATIGSVVSGPQGIDHLVTTDGRHLSFDLFVDCSGFRSLLLGQTLNTPYHSYASSLFTDTAITFNYPHGGRIKPYTTARSMNSGWCWNIPMVEDDHLGYVHSSAHCSVDQAADEVRQAYPGADDFRTVRFRSGRHADMWRDNVVAIGNSYAFVEPLESTGILMICMSIVLLVDGLPDSKRNRSVPAFMNAVTARRWDALRWFLSAHYKFNRKFDTPFWQAARDSTDVSGIQTLIDLYYDGAPLRFRSQNVCSALNEGAPPFYGLEGFDTIMLGQQVPARLARPPEPESAWRERYAIVDALLQTALPQREALAAIERHPDILTTLIEHPKSFVNNDRSM